MAEDGPPLHSFSMAPPTAATLDADLTIDDQHGHSTVIEDQDTTRLDSNATSESIVQQQDETIEEDAEHIDASNTENAEEEEEEDGDPADDDGQEEGASGTSVLPLSKIKKIFKTDPEHISASEAAIFTTAIATELFIQYFTEQASLIARSEKRKKLQYKDFSAAVSNIEQLYFLGDTVPKTYNLKKLVEQEKVRYNSDPSAKPLEKGQATLSFGKRGKASAKKVEEEDLPESDDDQDLGDELGYRYSDNENENQHLLRVPNPEDNDDSTDEEQDSVTEPHIRKDKDHDIIMN
jgi:DNA polymerase epsilon subunit 4